MNAHIRDTGRIPRLRDLCPEYKDAQRDYEAALEREDIACAERCFAEMQRIAQIFRSGFEACKATRDSGIRTWRAPG